MKHFNPVPRKGYEFIKFDVVAPNGSYIGQVWLEHPPIFKITIDEVKNAVSKAYPRLCKYIIEPLTKASNAIQPIEHIKTIQL